ncbi:MAG TPA: STAS domain-containing protein [Candidatus Bathyarchaeia archaeon]|nr:STAS domain-containing protein [Candidatus Bathyarchaeia archaeon]
MELGPKRFADVVALFPQGRIDHATADGFKIALAPHLAACAAGRDKVVLDLTGVEYISSVGLRVLMLASKQAKAQGGSLAVAGLQPVVREIFEISRFHLVLEVFPTLREALAKLSEAALTAFDAS